MSLTRVKQVMDGQKIALSSLEEGVRAYLTEEQTVEDIVSSLEDSELSEAEFKSLLDSSTESLLVEIVRSQVHTDLALWLLKQDIDESLKEDLVVEFLEYPDILHHSDVPLFEEIYTQGYLSPKEKKEHLSKASSSALLALTSHYLDNESEFNLILPHLDDLTVSRISQDSNIKTLPRILFDKRKDSLSDKEAMSYLTKGQNLTEEDKSFLVDRIISFKDPDNCYFLLAQGEYRRSSKKGEIFSVVFKSQWFNLSSLSSAIQRDCIDQALAQEIYDYQESKGQLKVLGEIVATQKPGSPVEIVDNRLSQESLKLIQNIFAPRTQILEDSTQGFYNFKTDKFIPQDLSLRVDNIKYHLTESHDQLFNSFNLWKPDVKVPAILKKQENKYFVDVDFDALSWDKEDFRSQNLEELREKFKAKIEILKSKIKIPAMNAKRPFGVELEICTESVRPSDLALLMEATDLSEDKEASEKRSIRPTWVVKYDETISHIINGKKITEELMLKKKLYTAEIVTPKLYGEEGIQELRSKLEELKSEYGEHISVNHTCGLHVHHDLSELFQEVPPDLLERMRQKLIEQNKDPAEAPAIIAKPQVEGNLESDLAKIQDVIYSLVAQDRRDNAFCPRMLINKDKVKQPELAYSVGGRSIRRPRPGFNLFTGYGTIEFRMHEATLDVEAIVQWVLITHYAVEEIIKKMFSDATKARENLMTVMDMMTMEKLRRLSSESDMELALREIEEFLEKTHFSRLYL